MPLTPIYITSVYPAIDSMQGRENKYTIFDIVLSFSHLGGPRFVVNRHRLNVALSRSQEMCIMVRNPRLEAAESI